jgi:crotonobetainyl-CoA:carnitine CoA-transferase CaiB-like acyl-CoA transferase
MRGGAGSPEWGAVPRFANNRRVAYRDLIDGGIAAALAEDPPTSGFTRLKTVGVPCRRINAAAEVFAQPQAVARATIETVDHLPGSMS